MLISALSFPTMAFGIPAGATMPFRRRFHHRIDADRERATGAVVAHQLLAELARELGSNDARDGIGGATRRLRNDEAYGSRGIGLCVQVVRRDDERRRDGCSHQCSAATRSTGSTVTIVVYPLSPTGVRPRVGSDPKRRYCRTFPATRSTGVSAAVSGCDVWGAALACADASRSACMRYSARAMRPASISSK